MLSMIVRRTLPALLLAGAGATLPVAAETPVKDRVGVLVTDWGTPEGFSPAYYFGIGYRSRVGEAQTDPRDQCADNFVDSDALPDFDSGELGDSTDVALTISASVPSRILGCPTMRPGNG